MNLTSSTSSSHQVVTKSLEVPKNEILKFFGGAIHKGLLIALILFVLWTAIVAGKNFLYMNKEKKGIEDSAQKLSFDLVKSNLHELLLVIGAILGVTYLSYNLYLSFKI